VNAKLDFDATKLFIALKYQILVAMEYCHTLKPGESLWIEVFGDVSVSDRAQIEVKYYADNLTDSHHNFWNTLNNWLKPEFDHSRFGNLVLLTTQPFGPTSSLAAWASISDNERLNLILKIHEVTKAHLQEIGKTSSKTLELQDKVLADSSRDRLLEVLPKIRIVTDQSELITRIECYKNEHLIMINDHRVDQYLDDMFGFMTNPGRITSGWQISREDFKNKSCELYGRYAKGSLRFPKLNNDLIDQGAKAIPLDSRLFALKLHEISADKETLLDAAYDLVHAEQYIVELINDCSMAKSAIDQYSDNTHRLHIDNRKYVMLSEKSTLQAACQQQLQNRSLTFYMDQLRSKVDPLSCYEDTPPAFRNGIFHLLADEEAGKRRHEFHWKLWS
jgi:hypothetical protein